MHPHCCCCCCCCCCFLPIQFIEFSLVVTWLERRIDFKCNKTSFDYLSDCFSLLASFLPRPYLFFCLTHTYANTNSFSLTHTCSIRGCKNTLNFPLCLLLSLFYPPTHVQTHRYRHTDTDTQTQTHRYRHTDTDTQIQHITWRKTEISLGRR